MPLLKISAQIVDKQSIEGAAYRVVFYNAENYFDTQSDTTRDYNEFTPEGEMHWTGIKYREKRACIFQMLMAIGGWEPLALVGFAEIENAFVLQDLIDNTPLRRENYQLVHFESDDKRGIDVGLIYHPQKFNLLSSKKIPVKNPGDPTFTTRDILYVKGLIAGDTLHVFVNHWVSRWRGLMESQFLRALCAEKLKSTIDSVCAINRNANILVMGDFNDGPEDESILKLATSAVGCQLSSVGLSTTNKEVKGTLKHGTEWNKFDQFLVSSALLSNKQGLWVKEAGGFIFAAPFLLEKDEKYLGVKPKRTYSGFKYNGGFSDHLPVFIDIFVNNPK
ncbi:MAG: endonuclease [Bacteroidales bacterium]|nr:endonuclease [Bacteroidales bacterium]